MCEEQDCCEKTVGGNMCEEQDCCEKTVGGNMCEEQDCCEKTSIYCIAIRSKRVIYTEAALAK